MQVRLHESSIVPGLPYTIIQSDALFAYYAINRVNHFVFLILFEHNIMLIRVLCLNLNFMRKTNDLMNWFFHTYVVLIYRTTPTIDFTTSRFMRWKCINCTAFLTEPGINKQYKRRVDNNRKLKQNRLHAYGCVCSCRIRIAWVHSLHNFIYTNNIVLIIFNM